MKIKRFAAAALASALAAAALTSAAYAATAAELMENGEELVLVPGDTKELVTVGTGISVNFNKEATYSGTVGGENNGEWLLGGDSTDTGITIENFKKYQYLEVDYEYSCDTEGAEPVEGVMLGLAFKIRIGGRLDDSMAAIYYDYTPETWVPYGPDGTNGRGTSINSLENIYRTQLKTEGTISIPVEELISIWEPDSEFILGIGFGADNNTYVSDEVKKEKQKYKVICKAVRLTNEQSENAAANYLNGVPEETEEAPAETTAAETTAAPETTPAETTAAETTAAPQTTAAPAANPAPAATAPNDMGLMIVLIVAIVVIVAAVIGIVVALAKKKK
ncbi:MAG: hypothetical protein ACI4J7_12225 [Ruminiclostridium sp.]